MAARIKLHIHTETEHFILFASLLASQIRFNNSAHVRPRMCFNTCALLFHCICQGDENDRFECEAVCGAKIETKCFYVSVFLYNVRLDLISISLMALLQKQNGVLFRVATIAYNTKSVVSGDPRGCETVQNWLTIIRCEF